jgi:cyclomaltodextrinase
MDSLLTGFIILTPYCSLFQATGKDDTMKFKQIVNLFYYACLGLLTLGLLASSVTEIHAFAAWASHAGNVFPHGPSSRDEVQVWVEVGCDDGNDGVQIADWVTNVSLYYRTGSQQPDGFNGTASAGSTAVALNWDHKEQNNGCPSGWASWWKGLIPPQKDGAQVRYVIESWHDQDPDPQHHHYADSVSFNQGVSTLMLGRGEATVFGYLVDDRYQKGNWSPEWARDAIFYQVFVDRFFDGSKNNNGSCPQRQPDGYCVKEIGSWNGGDLQGVIDKLGYLKDLGVNAIWLSPVFKTPEGPGDYHGYHVVDPQMVDGWGRTTLSN